MGKKLVKLFLITSAAVVFLLIFLFYNSRNTTIQTYQIYIEVAEIIGMNIDTDALYFGTVFPGGTASRDIVITHNKDFLKVEYEVEGDAAEFIQIREPHILYNKTTKITVIATIPANYPYGNYTGELHLVFTS